MSENERPMHRRLLDHRFALDARPEAQEALAKLRGVRNTATADDLAVSGDLAKGIFPDMDVRLEKHFLPNDKKWNTGHFPVGTCVIAGINEQSLREYTVAYLVRTDVRSYVIETDEPNTEIEGITRSINIDHVRQILKRGDGPVDIRMPLWAKIGQSKSVYSLNPRVSILQEAALSLIQKVGRHSWMGYTGKEELAAATPSITMDQLKVMLNRDLTKGRGEYITGSPQALVETLLEKRFIDGQLDADKLTTLLNARGIFYKKSLGGFVYYGANKKKLNRAIGQLFNKCKVRVVTAEKKLAAIDESFQLNNPFSEDPSRHFISGEARERLQKHIREAGKKPEDGGSHYDDHDERSHADHDRRDWDRLLRDL